MLNIIFLLPAIEAITTKMTKYLNFILFNNWKYFTKIKSVLIILIFRTIYSGVLKNTAIIFKLGFIKFVVIFFNVFYDKNLV